MPKKKAKAKPQPLGKSLIRDRFGAPRRGNAPQLPPEMRLHSEQVVPENITSVTESNDLAAFMENAVLAGTSFVAERRDISIVTTTQSPTLIEANKEAQAANAARLSVPRRPPWTREMTREELDVNERRSFLEWRKGLAILEQIDELILTPFEKNINVWRQLWRVVERSDVVTQIVDARNPLLFRSADLAKYVNEVDPTKKNLLLVNKADLLPLEYRRAWTEYFRANGIQFVFWSAVSAQKEVDDAIEARNNIDPRTLYREAPIINQDLAERGMGRRVGFALPTGGPAGMMGGVVGGDVPSAAADDEIVDTGVADLDIADVEEDDEEEGEEEGEESEGDDVAPGKDIAVEDEDGNAVTTTTTTAAAPSAVMTAMRAPLANDEKWDSHISTEHVFSREELLALFDRLAAQQKALTNVDRPIVIGMVGYPNVGKSSTINALYGEKKTAVGSTPGKTKHFQTLELAETITLCDCPGLVFPSFATTKADMIVSGILPIDQMRDHTGAMTLVCRRIPRPMLEGTYGVILPPPAAHEDQNRPPTAEEFLQAYAYIRGYMTVRGTPDEARASRYVLKDYYNGKLLYCHPPPAGWGIHVPAGFIPNGSTVVGVAVGDDEEADAGPDGALVPADVREKAEKRRKAVSDRPTFSDKLRPDLEFYNKQQATLDIATTATGRTEYAHKNKRIARAHEKAKLREEAARQQQLRAKAAAKRAATASVTGGSPSAAAGPSPKGKAPA